MVSIGDRIKFIDDANDYRVATVVSDVFTSENDVEEVSVVLEGSAHLWNRVAPRGTRLIIATNSIISTFPKDLKPSLQNCLSHFWFDRSGDVKYGLFAVNKVKVQKSNADEGLKYFGFATPKLFAKGSLPESVVRNGIYFNNRGIHTPSNEVGFGRRSSRDESKRETPSLVPGDFVFASYQAFDSDQNEEEVRYRLRDFCKLSDGLYDLFVEVYNARFGTRHNPPTMDRHASKLKARLDDTYLNLFGSAEFNALSEGEQSFIKRVMWV